MKLLCISSAADEKEDEEVQKVANSEPLNGAAKQDQESSQQQQQKPTKVRSWYNSLRRGLRRKSREPRVTISDPITSVQLTQSELIQINGVIEVKPTGNSPGAGNGDGEGGGGDDDHQEEIVAAEDATANGESGDDNKDTVNGRSSKTPPPALPPKPTSPITVGTKIGAVEKVENGNEEEEEEEEEGDEEQDDEEEKEETSLDLVGYSWFWGGISRRDAEALLRGRKDGTFLVRNSSDRPRFLYSLSFRSLGKTMHTRIEKSGGRLYFSSTEHAAAYKAAKKRGRRGGEGCQKREEGSRSLGGLISIAMNYGDENIFFYSRTGCQLHPQQGNEDKSSSSNNNNNGEEVPAPPGQATSTGLSLYTVHLNSPLNRFAYLLDFEYSESGSGGEIRGAEPEQKKALQYLCKFVLHHVPEAKARIQKDGWSPLKVLPLEMQLFAADAQYFPRPVKAA